MKNATRHIQSALAHLESLERNSALYDAAPSLLQALERFVERYDNGTGGNPSRIFYNAEYTIARNAIRRAKAQVPTAEESK